MSTIYLFGDTPRRAFNVSGTVMNYVDSGAEYLRGNHHGFDTVLPNPYRLLPEENSKFPLSVYNIKRFSDDTVTHKLYETHRALGDKHTVYRLLSEETARFPATDKPESHSPAKQADVVVYRNTHSGASGNAQPQGQESA